MDIHPPAGWQGDAKTLRKTFVFDSFGSAIAFMVEVAFFCDKSDHHPEWKNVYDKVWVELSTHDAGKVTDKDLKLAKVMDKAALRAPNT